MESGKGLPESWVPCASATRASARRGASERAAGAFPRLRGCCVSLCTTKYATQALQASLATARARAAAPQARGCRAWRGARLVGASATPGSRAPGAAGQGARAHALPHSAAPGRSVSSERPGPALVFWAREASRAVRAWTARALRRVGCAAVACLCGCSCAASAVRARGISRSRAMWWEMFQCALVK